MPGLPKPLTAVVIAIVLVASTGFSGGGTRPVEVDDFRTRAFANPSKTVDVAFGTSGVLSEVLVDRGSFVVAGEMLGKLDSRVEEVDLQIATERATSTAVIDRARAALELSQMQFEDAEQLHIADVIPQDQLDERRTELEVARTTLAEAQHEWRIAQLRRDRAHEVVERRRLMSPVSGVVMERFFEVGEQIEATEESALVRIAVVDPLRAEFNFDVESLGQYTAGDEVSLRFFAPTITEPVMGVVTVVDPVVDAASQTFRVRVEIANSGGRIPAGLECEIILDSE